MHFVLRKYREQDTSVDVEMQAEQENTKKRRRFRKDKK